jgi:hypothetical protein
MNENEPPPVPPALNRITPNSGMSRKWKIVLACAVGVGVALISLACFLLLAVFLYVAWTLP